MSSGRAGRKSDAAKEKLGSVVLEVVVVWSEAPS